MKPIILCFASVLLISCTKSKQDVSSVLIPASTEYLNEYLNKAPHSSYSLEEHLEMNLFTPKANLLTSAEKDYLKQAKEFLEPLPEWHLTKNDIYTLIYKNQGAIIFMQERRMDNIYVLTDSLLAKDILRKEEKQRLQQLSSYLMPYRGTDEAAIAFVQTIFEQNDRKEIINPWKVTDELDPYPDSVKQIIYTKMHGLNLSIFKEKYADQIPTFNDFVSTGIFLKNLKDSTNALSHDLHLYKFKYLLKTATREQIYIMYDALQQQLNLIEEEQKLLQQQVDKALAQLGVPMPNFTQLQDVEVGSGEALLSRIAKKHLGKIIYLDVWATWCEPCLAEMKNGRATKAYYSNKDVVFVYLCGGRCTETEMNAKIEALHVEGEHYVLTKREDEDLARIFNKRGYPKYRVIDRAGTLVRYANPRPSNLYNVRRVIDPLLQKID
ncbi:MAG: TlpA family protein disulfide reductase [Bacteroidota bacterium]